MRLLTRPAAVGDAATVAQLRWALWPDTTVAAHEVEVRAVVSGDPRSTLPLAILVAEAGGVLVGFVEVGLRSHADGCDPARPVGFLEGWYVVPASRGQGVGRALVAAAEEWARAHGCVEMASDTWIANEASQRAHEAIGFEVVDRCVNYRKRLSG